MSCAAGPVASVNPWALTLKHQRLAYALARRFARRNNMLDRLEDLRQEALLGMYEAARLFDPTHPRANFSTFGAEGALIYIRRAAREACSAPVRVPVRDYLQGVRAWAVSTNALAGGGDAGQLPPALLSQDRWDRQAEARVDAGRLMARASAQSFGPRHYRKARSSLRDVEAFFRVAQGESGEEIGAEAGVTRERVRQLSDRGRGLLRAAAGLSRCG